MTNTTPLYWEASGVSLHTHAWSISSRASRMTPPDKRGEDFLVPFRYGRSRTAKFREMRVMPLPMWTAPVNPDGSPDLTMDQEAKMYANWNYLLSVFDVEGEFPLVKRFYAEDGVTIKTATAMGELIDAPEPRMVAMDTLEFTMTIGLADPYFYAPEVTVPVGTINVEGTAPTDHIILTMDPGRVTGDDGNWIEYTGTGTATIDVRAGTAKNGIGQYINGKIQRNPNFPQWLTLKPGENVMTGAGTIKYEPAYK